MMRDLAALIGVGAVLAAGVVQGGWTDRWSRSDAVGEAASRLRDVPERIGDWTSRSMELDERQLEIGEIAGYLSRNYIHSSTGDRVSVLLVCGRPGPISVHTPDVCYGGAGYVIDREPAPIALDGPPRASFQTAFFRKDRPDAPTGLRILWAWGTGGGWSAPENPRLAFVTGKILYKMYVIREREVAESTRPLDAGLREFLTAFLPELERSLPPGAR